MVALLLVSTSDAAFPEDVHQHALRSYDFLLGFFGERDVQRLMHKRREPLPGRQSRIDLDVLLVEKDLPGRTFASELSFSDFDHGLVAGDADCVGHQRKRTEGVENEPEGDGHLHPQAHVGRRWRAILTDALAHLEQAEKARR